MKIISKKIAKLASLLIFASSSVFADEEVANTSFSESSVLMFCSVPEPESETHSDLFLDAFPKLISTMIKSANEGGLERAHYMGRLKDGFFLVFRGESLEKAQAKADELLALNDAVIKDVLATVDIKSDTAFSDSCKSFEIGPVAVLPTK